MGYDAEVYTATESQREVELYIVVTNPSAGGALRPFTLVINTDHGTASNSFLIIFYCNTFLINSNEDYTAVSGETIQFNVGDTVKTHTITIKQDMMCEDNSTEFFYSSLSLDSSEYHQIRLSQAQVSVNINDSEESECSKLLCMISYV